MHPKGYASQAHADERPIQCGRPHELFPQRTMVWTSESGVCVLVAETLVRPATSQEILKKQLLELRPSRQRRRTVYQDDEMDDRIPFTEDSRCST